MLVRSYQLVTTAKQLRDPTENGMKMSRKKILYIGNKLSAHGYTPTNIETLGPQLQEMYDVVTTSGKLNKWSRLADMTLTILQNRNANLMLIDTYSTAAFLFAKVAGRLARTFGIPYV